MGGRMTTKKHGFGILDWIDDSFPLRILRTLGPIALILGVISFLFALQDMRTDRDARAWMLLTRKAPGNSGKIEAIEYLNYHNPLSLPNPRRWGIPLGPLEAYSEDPLQPGHFVLVGEAGVPKEWIRLASNFGPWKERTPLIGLDLGCQIAPDGKRCESVGTYLRGAKLNDALLHYADLSGATLTEAILWDAWLIEANLANAELDRAFLNRAHMFGARLQRANLYRARLTNANLEHADLSYVNLNMASMRRADLQSANLVSADLRGAILAGANLQSAELKYADFGGADLSSAQNLTQEQINETCMHAETRLPDGIVATWTDCIRESEYGPVLRDWNGGVFRSDTTLEEACNQLASNKQLHQTSPELLWSRCFSADQ